MIQHCDYKLTVPCVSVVIVTWRL